LYVQYWISTTAQKSMAFLKILDYTLISAIFAVAYAIYYVHSMKFKDSVIQCGVRSGDNYLLCPSQRQAFLTNGLGIIQNLFSEEVL
jgi:hypothetical protein